MTSANMNDPAAEPDGIGTDSEQRRRASSVE
jgi:hypothetical protein